MKLAVIRLPEIITINSLHLWVKGGLKLCRLLFLLVVIVYSLHLWVKGGLKPLIATGDKAISKNSLHLWVKGGLKPGNALPAFSKYRRIPFTFG